MIKYLQETQYDKITLKINDITITDWYADYAFAVHAYTKSNMGGLLTIGKG